MSEKPWIDYKSLFLPIVMIFFLVNTYFLYGRSFFFLLKVGYAVIILAFRIQIGINIVRIIRN